MNRFSTIRTRLEDFARSDSAKRLGKILRVAGAIAVIAFLVRSLSGIGWGNLIQEMPRTPWFYVIIVVMYFLLPVFETFVYRPFLKAPKRTLLSAFIRKKVLNLDLMGYSGEVFLLMWAKQRLGIARSTMLRLMVDMGITSSIGGLTASGLLLGFLLFFDVLPLDMLIGDTDRTVVWGFLLIVAVLGLTGYQFRHKVFKLPGSTILKLYAAHLGRYMVIYVLQIAQWWVVLPDVSFVVWGTMLAIWTVTNRLPFLMTRDLVAIALILELPGSLLGGVESAVAAMLLTRIAADRVIGFSMFVPLSLASGGRKALTTEEAEDESSESEETAEVQHV